MGSGLEPVPKMNTARTISEVSRAVSSPQKGGQAGQVSPMCSVRITGEAPVSAVQAVRSSLRSTSNVRRAPDKRLTGCWMRVH